MHTIRPAAVAGSFYPRNSQTLVATIGAFLSHAEADSRRAADHQTLKTPPKAIIVPHAGYIYSGQTAAAAYAQLLPWHDSIKRVVLLGPVHRVPVHGLALPETDAFATPLGTVALDLDAIATISGMAQVVTSDAVHAQEHSLEVQLPFLQSVLDDFKLVPLAVGDATVHEVAEVLNALWGGPETIIVVSSDLSHYLPYQAAANVDKSTAHDILNMKSTLTHQQACGGTPVNGLIMAAKNHQLHPTLLSLCNSGDTAGDKERVVGYASFMFNEGADHA